MPERTSFRPKRQEKSKGISVIFWFLRESRLQRNGHKIQSIILWIRLGSVFFNDKEQNWISICQKRRVAEDPSTNSRKKIEKRKVLFWRLTQKLKIPKSNDELERRSWSWTKSTESYVQER